MESIAVWQGATLGGIVAWILISSYLNVTPNLSCNLGWLTMSSLGLLSSSRSRFYSTFATINENPDHHSCSIVSIYMVFCFSLEFTFFFFWIFFFFFQKYQHWFFDALFSGLSCVVSVPFYTAFLPLLFWVCSVSL